MLLSETTGPRDNEPTGEPESLFGKITHQFGGLATRDTAEPILKKAQEKAKY